MSRRLATVLAGAALIACAAPALAGPPVHVPDPQNCREVNAFLGIETTVPCDGLPEE